MPNMLHTYSLKLLIRALYGHLVWIWSDNKWRKCWCGQMWCHQVRFWTLAVHFWAMNVLVLNKIGLCTVSYFDYRCIHFKLQITLELKPTRHRTHNVWSTWLSEGEPLNVECCARTIKDSFLFHSSLSLDLLMVWVKSVFTTIPHTWSLSQQSPSIISRLSYICQYVSRISMDVWLCGEGNVTVKPDGNILTVVR